jgi:hypothetical protein
MKTSELCKDWDKAREEAKNKTPSIDLSRVLQEIDNRFNEVLDYLVFSESQRAAP